MVPQPRSILLLFWTGLAVGCGGSGGGSMTVTDSAGVAMVSNVDKGMWGEGAAWTVEEDLRIGVLEGDPEYQFGRIAWLTADADGSMYVLDQQAQHVQRYDADGRYVLTAGRPGSGPGEIGEAATFVGLSGDQTLIVYDLDNARLSLFGIDGQPAGTVALNPEQAGLPVTWRNTAMGVVARESRRLPNPELRIMPDSTDAIVTLAADGTDADTIMHVPSGGTLTVRNDNPNVEIFAPEPIWTLTDDLRVLYGVSDGYRIGVYEDGALTRVFSKTFTPVRVTDADRRGVMQGLLGLFGDVPQGVLDQVSSLVRFHDTFPVIAAVAAGPGGTYWVQRTRPASEIVELVEPDLRSLELLQRMGGPRWDVFDSQGRYLGIVSLPDRFILRLFRDDRIYGVWQDDLGVDYVMRLRVVQPG